MLVVTWSPACSSVSGIKRKTMTLLAPSKSRITATVPVSVRYLAALRRSTATTAEVCRIWKQTPRRSVKRSCPSRCLSHSCRELSPVAPVAVMSYERNNPVSSTSCHNNYQFPSYADSDMSNNSRMSEVTRPLRRSGSPIRGSNLTRQLEQVQEVHRGRPTPSHTNLQVLSTTTPLPGPKDTKHGWLLLPTPSALTVVPMAPPVLSLGPDHQPVRIRSWASSPLPGGIHLNTLLRSLLLGLAITSSGLAPQCIIVGSLAGFLPVATANRFALKNGYGTVEARYHLTAYDCSDPSDVQAYSSIPASHCSTRATPVQKHRPTRFQLLQKEKKRSSPHTFVSFLGCTSVTTAKCTDTLSWTPCTGPFQSHNE